MARSIAVALAAAALASTPSRADDAASSLPAALRKLSETGGIRATLERQGIRFAFTYYGDAFANPVGGIRQGAGYAGRFGTIIDADLERLLGWTGAAFHASIHQIHSTQFSTVNLANLMAVSGIEAPPTTRLFNLWIEQTLGSDLNLRLGQFTAAQEFLTSVNANLFINATFGWPLAAARDLPSSGPAYPEATPGARLAWTPNDRITVRAAVFDGDPSGAGFGNAVQQDPYGLAFRVNDPPFVIFETAYQWGRQTPDRVAMPGNPNQDDATADNTPRHGTDRDADPPGSLKLGGWAHTGSFADQRFDTQGGLLAAGAAAPRQHRGNAAVYAVLDQQLWHVPGQLARSLNGFLRLSAGPDDRNPVDLYADGGFTFNGPFAARPDDVFGLGAAWGRISPRAQAADRDLIALTGRGMPVRDYELALELTYQWKLAANWSIQPDLQLILHPGGHVLSPAASPAVTDGAIPDALVFGVRSFLKF
jgi:porin